MGKIEDRELKRIRKSKVQFAILTSVKTAGFLSVGLLAPNALQALKKLGLIPKPRQKEYVSSTAVKLVGKGLMAFKDGRYVLTSRGEEVLNYWESGEYQLPKYKKWDKKWRIIIFDIPEKKRQTRNRISTIFKQAGMYRLQDSVWVYPYDCEDIIGLLKTELGVGKYILYVIADEIENDKHLRKAFGLL